MHQPINWHEWSEEAFDQAKREEKPILLDIGAVWCHWCHVMDRESYEDPEIAEIVNQRFIAIKVDRDERPDVDSRYQIAVQAISGQGGWPLTAFLTSDGKPFYGGTYFPSADHYGRPSFRRVLMAISDAYRGKHSDVLEQAKLVEAAIAHSEFFATKTGGFSPEVIQEIVQSALTQFDEKHGGFGSAPKFPHPSILDLLIDEYVRMSGDARGSTDSSQKLLNAFSVTLEKMARGGVYDQLAGGFHRYSVDERWIVPHFEKMSYDNSELLKNYVRAYQATHNEFFAEVARDIIRWTDEWLTDRQRAGFYASQDADISLDDDGDYFTWTVNEARAVLTQPEAEIACLHYDINEIGEMHHNPAKNVLYQRASVNEIAARVQLSAGEVRKLLQSAKQKMYAARLKRPAPYIDRTIYVAWNALAISSYLQAACALQLEDARHFALRSLDRILSESWNEKTGLRHLIAYSDPQSPVRENLGFLDDYAFTALACLDAYESTSDLTYFKVGRQIGDQMIERFYDSDSGGFFDSPPAGRKLGVLGTARKPFQDSPTPAGNSMAAIALLRLHGYTDEKSYLEKAEQTLALLAGAAGQLGIFAATYGIAAAYLAHAHQQIVVIGDDDAAQQLFLEAVRIPLLGKSVLKLNPVHAVAENLPPALAETIPQFITGRSAAIVCSGNTCKPPVYSQSELRDMLAGT